MDLRSGMSAAVRCPERDSGSTIMKTWVKEKSEEKEKGTGKGGRDGGVKEKSMRE